MADSGKRQKMVLGVMAIAILYALFDFLTPKPQNTAIDIEKKTAELNTFVTDLTAGLGKDTTKNLGALIFSRAEKEWTQDPFLDRRSYKTWTEVKAVAKTPTKAADTPPPKIEFIYSGYVEIGGRRMAIINGTEYREGDLLDIKGYTLNSASPTAVVIENRGQKTTLTVPLQE